MHDYPRAIAILRARKRHRRGRDRAFRVTKSRMTALWHASFQKYKIPHQPMHSLRHTGPSRDVYVGYRTLAEVKKRGRWKGKEGVERYSKVHIYIKALSHLDPQLLARGQKLLEGWGRRPDKARQ